ncbi:MAG: nuclear transport factor 2 family protein [Bacteroidota bacterium]
MSTQEIANKWKEYCESASWDKAYEELYADNCVSIEMDGAEGLPHKVEGIDGIKKKGEQWNQMVEAFYGMEIEGPIVAGDHFTASMKMDIHMKGRDRQVDEEIALFRVENGKIVSEQFFYPLG